MKTSNVELNDLLKFPFHMKHRNKKLKDITVNINKTELLENGILLVANCNKHICNILIEDDNVNSESPVKVSCDCESFNFEFAHLLYDQHALLNPSHFIKAISRTPRKKNKFNVVCGCKHIMAFSNYINRYSDKLTNAINSIKKRTKNEYR